MGRFDTMKERFDEHDLESGLFLKFDDGDKHLVAFLGEPHLKEIYWEGGKSYPWKPGCGKPKVLKTSMNAAVVEKTKNGFQVICVKILENSKTFYKAVAKMDAKYGIDSQVFEVERDGTGTDTTYSVLPEGAINDELRAQLDELELHDLEKADEATGDDSKKKGATKSTKDEPATIITQDDGNDLIARLKTLRASLGEKGDAMMAEFLAKFGIKKIRELPAKCLKEAQSWVTQEEEALRHAAGDGEDDAFA
ncbi:MAG: hypothetical protein Q8O14_14850 [bacterium]|nr:hypothetical protein [bacterium]